MVGSGVSVQHFENSAEEKGTRRVVASGFPNRGAEELNRGGGGGLGVDGVWR